MDHTLPPLVSAARIVPLPVIDAVITDETECISVRVSEENNSSQKIHFTQFLSKFD